MALAGGPLNRTRVAALAAGPILIATATWLITRATRGYRWALPALVVLMGVDVGTYGLSYSVYRNLWRLPLPNETSALPSGSTRIAVQLPDPEDPVRVGDALVLRGFSLVDGYAALEPVRVLDYRDPVALRLAGVGLALRKSVEDQTVNSLFQWLRRNLLLILQLLCVLLLIFAVMAFKVFGGGGKHYILIIDCSASMNAQKRLR